MEAAYDADYVRRYYDEYGEREWQRLELHPRARVSFFIHRHYLGEYVRGGEHVLEAGAGPGRFTIELARLGARVTVGDISPVQLALNREKVAAAGCEANVVARELLDIVDLSRFGSQSFDAVVCYGGALSYAFDRAETALAELLRVTKRGGFVLLSVMSLLGSTQQFLGGVAVAAEEFGTAAVERVQVGGDLTGAVAGGHNCHMYRWSELQTLFERQACSLVTASASNYLSIANEETLQKIAASSDLWAALLRWELDYTREPGAIDGGSHIIAVLRRA